VVQTLTLQARNPYVWCGGVFVGVIAAQLLSTALWSHQGGTHIAWFPGAVLLSVLLSVPPRLWPACILASLLGMLTVAVGFHLPVTDTLLVVTPSLLLTSVAAWLLQLVPDSAPPLEDFGKLAVFGVVAVVLLPAVSATCIEYVSRFTSFRASVLMDWPNIALAHALGYALYVPVWVSVRCPDAAVRHATHVPWGFVGIELVMVAILGVIWYLLGDRVELTPLLCLAPAPIIISACIRTQMTGSSIVVFIIVILAAHLSVLNKGPFLSETPQQTTLALQLWTLAVSLSALTLGVLVEQRAAARRALTVAHSDVREMAGRLIATMEQERARLARDLHDDVSQRLAASSIGLSALRRRLDPKHRADVSTIQDQVIALSEDVRQLSHELHPSCLAHAGLYDALESLCVGHRRARGPQIFFVGDRKADQLAPEVALCFYRVTQEALANALRHAAATKITVKVSVAMEQTALWIFDDGVGFDAASTYVARPGIGLISMQERTKLLGGSFDIRSAPGRGVDLCVRIPLVTN
jgi:two-component system sensor histidine kinase UhpB